MSNLSFHKHILIIALLYFTLDVNLFNLKYLDVTDHKKQESIGNQNMQMEIIIQFYHNNLGYLSKQRMHTKALNFLHQMNYNFIRAKFYIVFPYFLTYNLYKSNNKIILSDQQMEKKIKQHLQGLKNSKTKDLQKWIGQIQSSIQSRISINKLNALIQQAKQNKFQVPETIKQQIEKSTKLGRQLKKIISQTKMPFDKLIAKKQLLNDQKIITNQMILFQQTLTRCEQWIAKVNKFQNQNFQNAIDIKKGNQQIQKVLKKLPQKIQYKTISMLVNQYNYLPLSMPSFEANTKKLHDQTNVLLEKLPQFIKNNKTRTANPTKVSYSGIRNLLKDIALHPVNHQQFEILGRQIRQSLELIQKVSMFLEDQRTQKSIKIMSGYLKLANDIPIHNNISERLNAYIDYYNIIEKIKKDIINPNKFQQTQQLLNQANQKGYFSAQLLEYQSKLKVYRGWFQSTQILSQGQCEIKLVDLIKKQSQLIVNMIQQSVFRDQLQSAKTQLNIQTQLLEQYSKKFTQIQSQKHKVRILLSKQDPELKQLVHELLSCINNSIKYPEIISLYIRVKTAFTVIVKIEFLMDHYKFNDGNNMNYFFKKQQYQQILSIVSSKKEIRQMSKDEGQKLLVELQKKTFPKQLIQVQMFKKFMEFARQWQIQVIQFLQLYQKTNQINIQQLDKLLTRTTDVLTNESLILKLNQIQQIVKWKSILQSKIQDKGLMIFNQQQIKIISQIYQEISKYQNSQNIQNLKHGALKYLSDNKRLINQLITVILTAPIQKTQKLTQIIKLYKQIERLNLIKDQNLQRLKQRLYNEILVCENWKQKYNAIRKIDIKRIIRRQQELKDTVQKQEVDKQQKIYIENGNLNFQQGSFQTEQRQKSIRQYKKKQKYALKNPQFCYYFKLPLLLIQFYNGTKLKIYLQQLNKIKSLLNQVNQFNIQSQKLKKQKTTASAIQILQAEANKLNILFLESWKLKKKNNYIQYWIKMASNLIDSVPILKMQQLQKKMTITTPTINQAPRQPEQNQQKNEFKNSNKIQKETLVNNQISQINQKQQNIGLQQIAQKNPQKRQKRQRKINKYYSNDQITLLTQQLYNPKSKKKRKINSTQDSQIIGQKRKNQSRKQNKNQQMQRQVQQYLEQPTIYCICRMGLLNQVSFMLQCEYCQIWFHTQCIGIRKSYVKNVDKYYCVVCSKRYNIHEDYMDNFFWQYHIKIKQEQFNTLLDEGRDIGVTIDQLQKLEVINSKIQNWKKQVSKYINMVMNRPKQSIMKQTYVQIFELYLQSFWFPTIHAQTAAIQLFLFKYWKNSQQS